MVKKISNDDNNVIKKNKKKDNCLDNVDNVNNIDNEHNYEEKYDSETITKNYNDLNENICNMQYEILNYCTQQSLPICEYLDTETLFSYLQFLQEQ